MKHKDDFKYLDQREQILLEKLTDDYQKLIEPGKIKKNIDKTIESVSNKVPEKIKEYSINAIEKASEWEIILKVMEKAGKGVEVVNENSARLTFSKHKIVEYLNDEKVKEFEQICLLRSYYIERKMINRRKNIDLPTAFVGGGVTGFFGIFGMPFNIAYTFFIYFRAVQSVALFYGYDVIEDPRELEFASSVTMTCLSPKQSVDGENLGSVIGKMMVATNVTTLKDSLTRLSYTQMAEKGGAELLYVQIRALANASAKKALANAGEKGIEAGIFKKLLQQIGKKMSKDTGKKAIPVIGAVIGALYDTYTMNKIINRANLIYHKRFLFEKDIRIQELKQISNKNIVLE